MSDSTSAAIPYEERLLHFLTASSSESNLGIENKPFVLSTCASCDRSGQWLHYGQAGRGIAVGFRVDGISPAAADLVQVDYDPDSQRRRIGALIDCARPFSSRIERGESELAARLVSHYVSWLAIQFKHPSFAEEREWRFTNSAVFVDGAPVDGAESKWRQSGDRLIPYQELFLKTLDSVSEVVVGYSSAVTSESVSLMLRQRKLATAVRRSEVPVR